MWLPGATGISKYPKLSKMISFCNSQSDAFSRFFVFFFWLNVVKRSSNEILNSWRNEKLSTSMKLDREYYILMLKINFENSPLFPGLVIASKLLYFTILFYTLLHWLYFTYFHFALRNVSFQWQNVTQIVCLWVKLW